MRRPWQIWTLFALCLAMVLPAMLWLTHRAVLLDRADALAQQQADVEEAVGSALWQMDAELTQLVAPEIARPAAFFQPFYGLPGKGQTQQVPSPLLRQPSPYVLLHFQLGPDGNWKSPQCPTGAQYELAVANGVVAENIRLSNSRLQELSGGIGYTVLRDKLPSQTLPTQLGMQTPWTDNSALVNQPQQTKVMNNILDNRQVQQQLENPQSNSASEVEQGEFPLAQGGNPYNVKRQQMSQSRRSSELQSRNAVLQQAAGQQVLEQRFNYDVVPADRAVAEGVSQSLWIDSHLLLARRVQVGHETLIQGCWLDWPKIKAQLLARIAAILPDADLVPVTAPDVARVGRLLAALPVQLVVPRVELVLDPFSPSRISLIIAWLFLTLATLAVATLLRGVVSLSERRAAFVSAVTHELRTPLTTFRLYAEMLAAGMVSDPQQRQTYLETLQVEADRLSHLVENVLLYARLERGAGPRRREQVTVVAVLARVGPRLAERAAQAGMTLEIEDDEASRSVQLATDPAAVEQILMNLVDNACKYAVSATDRRIRLRVNAVGRSVTWRVQDYGPGISASERRRLFRPFSKSAQQAANSAPGVGLGLALCHRLAQELRGRLECVPAGETGATFVLTLPR
ncbi:MAG: HAMP domain-containing sensor histidine kinase [Planctomycetota bacterium]|nr:HAMP domain-containing sensor histidine kinase [Planctomycetota bacterium]